MRRARGRARHHPASGPRAQASRRLRGGRAGIITGMSANPHRLAPAPALREGLFGDFVETYYRLLEERSNG